MGNRLCPSIQKSPLTLPIPLDRAIIPLWSQSRSSPPITSAILQRSPKTWRKEDHHHHQTMPRMCLQSSWSTDQRSKTSRHTPREWQEISSNSATAQKTTRPTRSSLTRRSTAQSIEIPSMASHQRRQQPQGNHQPILNPQDISINNPVDYPPHGSYNISIP